MKISQLSTFIENRSGRLHAACEALAARGINIHTLCLADSRDFGILRLIVADPPARARRARRLSQASARSPRPAPAPRR